MRTFRYLLFLGLLTSTSFQCTRAEAAATRSATPAAAHQELILVELFTSQGCSSCPPADAFLSELVTEGAHGHLPIVALSYHVDYWNRLGWTDPYSQAAFSKRQRDYAHKLPDPSVYTPQIIVHGRSGHVGSRRAEIRRAIQSALKTGSHTHLQIDKRSGERGQTFLVYQLEGATNNLILNIALVEAAIGNEVPRGENRGRQLQHVQVVRDLQQIARPANPGSVRIDPTKLEIPEQGQVVVFVQDADTWAVRAVAVLEGL
jgi:hypothetical protein